MSNPSAGEPVDLDTLAEIEQRILWLAVRMVDHANLGDAGGIKVGGHQASSASMTSIMAALWFAHLNGNDKVAVKPHASPVYHAIKYLTGELDRSYLTRLRKQGGLQAYPSRTKDPDVADFSTGSVGLGAVAPLFAAATRRYVDAHFGDRAPARFIATIGDAELDEGNVWEAIADSATHGLGSVMLIVDLNRQSLDRIVPQIQAGRLEQFFANAGWHIAEVKYGRRLQAAFAEPGGSDLRALIDGMPNEEYQQLFVLEADVLRARLEARVGAKLRKRFAALADDELRALIFDLGGHDLAELIDAYRQCDAHPDQPSVVFAYTIKGWGLPYAGQALNHSALLPPDQIDAFRSAVGLDLETEWDRFDPDSPAGRLCARVGGELNNVPPPERKRLEAPQSSGRNAGSGAVSTQEAFGKALAALADVDGVGERIVTTSPDVSISTNLGNWINKVGVFAPYELDDFGGAERLLKWAPGPTGRHIELGISEMNLFMLLSQLGLAHEHHGEVLVPVGTVYDPFVLRGLDAFIYGLYNGSRFIVAGTPSGVSLSPEGGAHQSTITPSVGLELPGVVAFEPAFALETDWVLCDSVDEMTRPGGTSRYLRLSTRPIDQSAFAEARARLGDEVLRRHVMEGGYRLVEAPADGRPGVTLVGTGAILPEVVAAAAVLDDEGVAASVVAISSADRLFHVWQQRLRRAAGAGEVPTEDSVLDRLVPGDERARPVVSVHDGASHTLAWLGSAFGVAQFPLGVDRFGESGTIDELYHLTGIDTGTIVNAALIAVDGVLRARERP
jgi:pyruvate dehydrogenase E1 component